MRIVDPKMEARCPVDIIAASSAMSSRAAQAEKKDGA